MSTATTEIAPTPVLTPDEQKAFIIRSLLSNRPMAHRHFFAHRHKNADPPFHKELLNLFYSTSSLIALQAFRGAAKSTLVEEYVVMTALYREARYILIIGNTWTSAVQRLQSVKHELENNDAITSVFGDQVGPTWSQDEIVLTNGCKIQAVGARQSLRGFKHNEARPDLAVIDDFEDDEGVATEEARAKTNTWLYKVLLPALDISCRRVRMLGTPLHPKALMETHMNNPGWESKRFPIMYIDPDTGADTPTWPDRFPLNVINDIKQAYIAEGNGTAFMQEYMCQSEDSDNKPFQQSMIRIEAAPRLWSPVTIMVDPARTTNAKSARTGYAAWTWTGHKMHVIEAYGGFHQPDEIINNIFKLDERYEPAAIGVETDGLEEFLMQPLRTEMVKRSTLLPIVKQKAPRDKLGFITGLRPFFMAGDVTLSPVCNDLITELLAFPTGRIDVVNALAYALKMRPGKPVYEDFNGKHIRSNFDTIPRTPFYLLVSSRPSMTTGVLLQFKDNTLRIHKDWVQYGPPQEQLQTILQEASVYGNDIKVMAPEEQFDRYSNSGMPVAARNCGVTILKGANALKSSGSLAPWLQKQVRGEPALQIDEHCRWLVNGMASGYCRMLTRGVTLSEEIEDNQYKVLIEALEAFVMVFKRIEDDSDNHYQKRYATTQDGRRYLTTLPQ